MSKRSFFLIREMLVFGLIPSFGVMILRFAFIGFDFGIIDIDFIGTTFGISFIFLAIGFILGLKSYKKYKQK